MDIKGRLIEYFKTLTYEDWERGYEYNFYNDFIYENSSSALLKKGGKELHSDKLVDDIIKVVEEK
ncbi:hypothetical protein LCGC14_0788860 [marine sediment metagenome]|uniref:Uncharacterized protein n=1 Tax=marine sediment metagenome TaxID=412755 RepID=A0A0F9PTC8_9ZZZZ